MFEPTVTIIYLLPRMSHDSEGVPLDAYVAGPDSKMSDIEGGGAEGE